MIFVGAVFYLHSAEDPHLYSGEMNAVLVSFQWAKIKPPADVTDFQRNEYKDVSLKPSHPAKTAN